MRAPCARVSRSLRIRALRVCIPPRWPCTRAPRALVLRARPPRVLFELLGCVLVVCVVVVLVLVLAVIGLRVQLALVVVVAVVTVFGVSRVLAAAGCVCGWVV